MKKSMWSLIVAGCVLTLAPTTACAVDDGTEKESVGVSQERLTIVVPAQKKTKARGIERWELGLDGSGDFFTRGLSRTNGVVSEMLMKTFTDASGKTLRSVTAAGRTLTFEADGRVVANDLSDVTDAALLSDDLEAFKRSGLVPYDDCDIALADVAVAVAAVVAACGAAIGTGGIAGPLCAVATFNLGIQGVKANRACNKAQTQAPQAD